VPLLEDCALTFGATHRGRPLGAWGDAAFFSMRKVLLYPEGGALVVGERLRDFRPAYVRRVSSCFSAPRFLAQRAKHAYVRLTRGADPLRLVRAGPEGFMDGRARQELEVKMLSTFTRLRLPFSDVERAAARRRENYRYVLERLPASGGVRPMFAALPDGVTPYSFPLVARADRDGLRRALVADGILAAAGWPESPFDARLARTRALAQTVVELPIHQATTRPQLDRALRAVERWSRPRTVVRAFAAP
jgi:dTDP-4-amino-4,6-dideoxygalactose transaminase